jgi:hypothetical protein
MYCLVAGNPEFGGAHELPLRYVAALIVESGHERSRTAARPLWVISCRDGLIWRRPLCPRKLPRQLTTGRQRPSPPPCATRIRPSILVLLLEHDGGFVGQGELVEIRCGHAFCPRVCSGWSFAPNSDALPSSPDEDFERQTVLNRYSEPVDDGGDDHLALWSARFPAPRVKASLSTRRRFAAALADRRVRFGPISDIALE